MQNTYHKFLEHLEKQTPGLKENIDKWQEIILKSDTQKQSSGERNILSWYRFNSISYHSSKYRLNPEKAHILQEFQEDPYYIFKNMVEIMGRDLVSKHLRKILTPTLDPETGRIEIFIASDADDVFGGVDLICKIQNKNQTEYLGIDIAVSDNIEYLQKKSDSKNKSICIEFNLRENLNPTQKIERKVLHFCPKIMAEMLKQYLEAIEKGEYIDTLELYNKISNENTKGKIKFQQNKIRQQCYTILHIN